MECEIMNLLKKEYLERKYSTYIKRTKKYQKKGSIGLVLKGECFVPLSTAYCLLFLIPHTYIACFHGSSTNILCTKNSNFSPFMELQSSKVF